MSSDISYPSPDLSGYMTTASAETTIATMNATITSDAARITALEAKKGLVQIGTATLGETALISLSLGVKRYTVNIAGVTTGDRIMAALSGVPTNGTIQDAYASAAGVVSIGVLVPAIGIGATISVPVVIYKIV